MTAASKAISLRGIKRRALSIGAVKAFDHALQFLLPVVLVRCLDTATFGEYRLLWLALGTVTVASLNMHGGGLYYFLPRSDGHKKRLYVHQTLLYLAAVGLVCGWAVSPWNPLLPEAVRPLAQYGGLVPAFVALWMTAMVLDTLPTVDEKISIQAYATVGMSLLRVLLVGLGAWFTGDLRVVLWLLIALVLIKLAMLLVYIQRRHGLGRPWFERSSFAAQFRHVAPFGISNALFRLRAQADQWVAASLFALSSFAAFSIAGMVGQVVHIFRVSVLDALLPQMSRMHAAGDVHGMVEMNRRGNVMVGTLLYPLLAFTFVFADDIVTVIYTAAYVEAAPAIRVYVVAMALRVIEVASLLLLLGLGPFAVKVNALSLVVSALVSWFAALQFGLAGAAAGGLVATYLDRALLLRRISACSGIPLAQLQNWRGLAHSMALATLAGILAWGMVSAFFKDSPPLLRLAVGGAVLALVYSCTYLRSKVK
jgi:O-antigen/teichoic acid export membrane protein